jgi:hypothetical protein
MPLLRALAFLLLTGALAAPATAATIVLREPGYLAIDGSYYVFDLPVLNGITEPAELHPLAGDGFFLRSLLAVDGCVDGGGQGGGAVPGTQPALRHAVALDLVNAPRLGLRRRNNDAQATISLATCDGAVVMFARSVNGATVCSGAIPFPFRRGQCAAVDNADPGLVFFNAFEP